MLALATCQNSLTARLQEDTSMHYLTLPDGTLAYDIQGSGPLLVLLPGLGDLRQSYRFLTPMLVEAGYQVVSMDLRGHGDSSAVWPDYHTASVAADVLALLAHLDAGPALLVCNSFSAGVAVWAATEKPAAISGIAMIGPFVRDHHLSLLLHGTLAVLFNGPWRVNAWGWFHGSLFPTAKPVDHAAYQARLKASLREPGRFEAVKAMLARSDAEVATRLPAITVPVLIIMGSKDPDYPDPEAEARWIAGQTQGRVALIPDAGHYPQAEMPEPTATLLLEFLETLH